MQNQPNENPQSTSNIQACAAEDFEGLVCTASVAALEGDAIRLQLAPGVTCALAAGEQKAQQSLCVGDELQVFVERSPDDAETMIASRDKAEALALWAELERAVATGSIWKGEVVSKIKGGYAVDIGVKAFLPASQATLQQGGQSEPLLGKTLEFNIIEFNKKRGNLVVSRKKQLEAEQATRRDAALAKLVVGEVVTGKVRSFTDYGAFVDLGGVDGLVHITDLGWSRLKHPSEAVKLGEEIKVKILSVDAERGRISLSRKQLLPDPWIELSEKFPPGTKIKKPIVSLTNYGAFVELLPGIDGLVHVSEMSWTKRPNHPSDLVSVGQEVEAVVLELDGNQRRVALGMKQAQPNPWDAFAESHPVGSRVKGTVARVKDFGVFVTTEEGLDGLVRAGDLSWSQRVANPADLYKPGDEVEAVVLELEPAKERMALGIKQLNEDPWEVFAKQTPAGSRVTGKVTRIADFGVFVELAPGIEGLCHISQLAEERVQKATEVTNVGQDLEVMVLEIDRDKRRIGLSVKALSDDTGDYRTYEKEQKASESVFGNFFGDALAQKLARDKEAEAAKEPTSADSKD